MWTVNEQNRLSQIEEKLIQISCRINNQSLLHQFYEKYNSINKYKNLLVDSTMLLQNPKKFLLGLETRIKNLEIEMDAIEQAYLQRQLEAQDKYLSEKFGNLNITPVNNAARDYGDDTLYANPAGMYLPSQRQPQHFPLTSMRTQIPQSSDFEAFICPEFKPWS